jgi:hypothetical protein
MAKKETKVEDSFFGGFEAVVDGLARPGGVSKRPGSGMPGGEEDTVLDMTKMRVGPDYGDKEEDMIEQSIALDVTPEEEEEPIIPTKITKPKEDEDDEEIEEENAEEEGGLQVTPEKDDTTATTTDLSEYETDIVDYFSEQLSKELGWEFEEETKPKSVQDIIDYMSAVVEENSKPDFASEDIQKLNDFVKDGGDFKKFLSEAYGGTDYENIDISSERNQKKVITENLMRLGYSEPKIQKSLARYEEAGTLEEEAEEALEVLKENTANKAQQLLADQQKLQQESRKQQQKFYSDVQSTVGQLDSIRGIPVTSKEKKELLDYIFKPEADGRTKYQKDYAKNYKNLIESAYFTMRGDSLLSKVANKATSQAARNLQEKLASKGKRTKSSGTVVGNQNTLSAWDAVSSQLRRPKY